MMSTEFSSPQRDKKNLLVFIFSLPIPSSLSTGAPTPVLGDPPSSKHQDTECRPGTHLVLVIDGLSPGWIIGMQLRIPPGQAQQHCPLQIHPELGAQVNLGGLEKGSLQLSCTKGPAAREHRSLPAP